MYVLHIEHPVPDFDNWKTAFDSDPVDRKKSGVQTYQISRSLENPNYVTIDLTFQSAAEAQALLAAMQKVWSRVSGSIMNNPQARISEIVETRAI